MQLEPLPRKILKHLRHRKTISPMEAIVTYGTTRLAPAIHELRKAGFDIETKLRRDENGRSYAKYRLVAGVK